MTFTSSSKSSNSSYSNKSSSGGIWSGSGSSSSNSQYHRTYSSTTYPNSTLKTEHQKPISNSINIQKNSNSPIVPPPNFEENKNWFSWLSKSNKKPEDIKQPDKSNLPSLPPMTVGSRDTLGGRIVDNVATGMAVGTGSAIAHRVINSIGSSETSTSKLQSLTSNNTCSLLKEFYDSNKSKFDFDEDFNSKFMSLCNKLDCKF